MKRGGNARLVRRYFAECVAVVGGERRKAALALADDLLTPDFLMAYNNDEEGTAGRTRAAHKAFLVRHARSFRDDEWAVEELLTDEDVVACRWRILATAAETGRRVDVRAADFFPVRDGRLAELRRFLDFEYLGRQIRGEQDRT